MDRRTAPREARPETPSPGDRVLRLDPSSCAGVGICAHLADVLITVDSWGYPIVSSEPLRSARERRQAEAAAGACPRRALRVTG